MLDKDFFGLQAGVSSSFSSVQQSVDSLSCIFWRYDFQTCNRLHVIVIVNLKDTSYRIDNLIGQLVNELSFYR